MAKNEQGNWRVAGWSASFLALGVLVLANAGETMAGQMDCGKLAAKLNHGDRYQFKIQLQTKSIRLEKDDDFCSEPVDEWFARQLILPRPARDNRPREAAKPTKPDLAEDNTPLPSVDNMPLPGQIMRQAPLPDLGIGDGGSAAMVPTMRITAEQQAEQRKAVEADASQPLEGGVAEPVAQPVEGGVAEPVAQPVEGSPSPEQAAPDAVSPTSSTEVEIKADEIPTMDVDLVTPSMVGVVAPPPPEYDPEIAKQCDLSVTNLWAPGEYHIDGQTFWLSGVFTIDYDGDGRIDDVGFKLNSEGKIGNVLNYFPTSGDRLSGKTVASLRLGDESYIGRLCAENVTFERPEMEPAPPMRDATTAPERMVAGPAIKAAEPEPEKQPEPEAEKTPEENAANMIMLMGGAAMLLMLFGVVGFILFLRGTSSDDDDDDDYDDDDEYEYEDED